MMHEMVSFIAFLCGVCFLVNLTFRQYEDELRRSDMLVFQYNGEPYENGQRRSMPAAPIKLQYNYSEGQRGAVNLHTQEVHQCSVIHPKLNSCNTLPNYFLYPERRGEFQSPIIIFWHVQKAGGSSVENCLKAMPTNLNLPPTQRGGVTCNQMKETYSNKKYFQKETHKPVVRGHNTLGLCQFFHEKISGRKCSTFAIFREPYERAVSHYYFSRQKAKEGIAVAGYQRALRMPINEWVKINGSPVWKAYSQIWDINVTENGTMYCKMTPMKIPGKSWPTDETIIDEIIDNLDKHLSFVGLLEDMSTTYQMLEEIYNLPFVSECYGRHTNQGKYDGLNITEKRELAKTAKLQLMEDEEIRKLMSFDVRLYEKAREIFNEQKKIRALGLKAVRDKV